MSNDAFSSPDLSALADAVQRDDAAEVRRQLERIDADTPGSDGSATLLVKSPVTDQTYTMRCSGATVTTCTGGNDASVVLY